MNGWTKTFGIIEMIAAVIFTVAVVLAKLDGMSIAAISLDDFLANDTYKLLTIAAGGLAVIGGLGSIVAGSKARSAFNCVLGALVALMGAVYLMAATGEIDWVQSNVDLFLTVLFAVTAIMAIAFTVSRRRYVGIVVFIILFLFILVLKGRDFDGEIVDVLGFGFPLYAFAADMFMPIVGAMLLFFIGFFVTLYAVKESRAVVVVEASEEEIVEEASEEPAPAAAAEEPVAAVEEEKPAPAEPAPAVAVKSAAEEKPAPAVEEEKPAEEPAPSVAAPAAEEKPAEDIPAMPKVMSSQAAAATAAAAKAEQEERLSEESAAEEKPAEDTPAVSEEDGENLPEEDSEPMSEDEGDDSSFDDLGLEPDTPETFVRRAAWNKGLRCRRNYGKHKIPVAFVKGKVAVFVDDGVPSASRDEVLVKEGWTVLHFAEADVTDGSIEADIILKAVKENVKSTKKKRKTTKR